MIQNSEFDTIYHEHVSFFNVASISLLCESVGLRLLEVEKVAVHGTSYLFTIGHLHNLPSQSVVSSLAAEISSGTYDSYTYSRYAFSIHEISLRFNQRLSSLRSSGIKLVGYGAAAKGNTFLNFTQADLDYIVDDNVLKQGLFSPGRCIPIRPVSELLNEDPSKLCVIPLAWNFSAEIKSNVRNLLGTSPRFYLEYFPDVLLTES